MVVIYTLTPNSLGLWALQHLYDAASEVRRSLTEKFGQDSWQHESVHQLFNVLRNITPDYEKPVSRVSLRQWFSNFAALRRSVNQSCIAAISQDAAKIVSNLESA